LTELLEKEATGLLHLAFQRTRLERLKADCVAEDLKARQVQK